MSARPRWLLLAVACAVLGLVWMLLGIAPPPDEGRQLFGKWSTRDFAVGVVLGWIAAALLVRARSRRALFGWLLATGLAGFSWLLLEAAALLGAVSYPEVFGLGPRQVLGKQLTPHLDVTGETEQELTARWRIPSAPVPFRYRTDRYGLRNTPDRAEADVYCLGDSFIVAGLVPHEATVSARLEAAWNRPVMRVALIGIGAQEQRDLLADLGLPLRDKLVLQFVTEGNDLVDSRRYRQPPAPPGVYEQSFLSNFLRWLHRLTQPIPAEAWRHRGLLGEQEHFFLWDEFSFAGLDGEVPHLLETLREQHAAVQAAGGRHALVYIPSKLRVLGALCAWPEGSDLADYRRHLNPLRERLVAWSSAEEIPLLDLTEVLQRSAADGDAPYFPVDSHWNEIGHEVAARELANWSAIGY